MTPVLLTLPEHAVATFSVSPKHPQALREAAESFCARQSSGISVDGKSDSGEPLPLNYSVAKRGEIINIHIAVSYFAGFDWIFPGLLGVRVLPKLDQEDRRIDILGMLRKAMAEPENFDYLQGLLQVNFRKPTHLDTQDSAGLGLFLATLYLSVLDRIVRKGLQRKFYSSEEIFRQKIKGQVLFSKTISGRHSPRLSDRLYCRVQEFGVDVLENRILKRALRLVLRFLQTKAALLPESEMLIKKASALLRAFAPVPDNRLTVQDAANLPKAIQPFFRDYREGLDLAVKILKMESLACADTTCQGGVPVHWINMAKLFELYAYAKLREKLGANEKIRYQFQANWQYPDFLCRADDQSLSEGVPRFFIADAKYKPHYANGNSGLIADMRQLSGYARLSGVLDEFQRWGRTERDQILPCVVIYSDQSLSDKDLNWAKLKAIPRWELMYKIGIRLPEV